MSMDALSITLTVIYLLPWLVAIFRKHKEVGAIALMNVLFGWTVIGWFFALSWSVDSI